MSRALLLAWSQPLYPTGSVSASALGPCSYPDGRLSQERTDCFPVRPGIGRAAGAVGVGYAAVDGGLEHRSRVRLRVVADHVDRFRWAVALQRLCAHRQIRIAAPMDGRARLGRPVYSGVAGCVLLRRASRELRRFWRPRSRHQLSFGWTRV